MPKYLQKIPPIFYNSNTEKPINQCLVCDTNLLSDTEYIIEKSMVNYPGTGSLDLIWEFAICINCMNHVMDEYSKESHQAMNTYFMENMNLKRQTTLASNNNFDANAWLSECIITGKHQNTCSQFQICLQCVGEQAIFDRTPFMISDEAMDEVTKLLSNSTIEAMNRFRDIHFPPPEDLRPFFRKKDFVLI